MVAQKTGATLVETEIPFSLDGASGWVSRVASAVDSVAAGEAFIDAELARTVPSLRWVIERQLLHQRALFLGDPHFLGPVASLVEELGVELCRAIVCGRERPLAEVSCPVDVEVTAPMLRRTLQDSRPAILIHNDVAPGGLPPGAEMHPTVNFGFPSFEYHGMADAPFLGFSGAVAFAGRLASARCQFQNTPRRSTT